MLFNQKSPNKRGIHLSYQVDFELHVLGQFKIELCFHINFYIIVNPYFLTDLSNQVRIQGRLNIRLKIYIKPLNRPLLQDTIQKYLHVKYL